MKAGSDCWKLPLKAKETSMDAAAMAVLSELDGETNKGTAGGGL